jgi:hypothetical protein
MFGDLAPIVFSVVIGIALFGLVLGAMYRGGGMDPIRRQVPMVAALGIGIAAAVILLPVFNSVLGQAATTVMIVIGGLSLMAYSTLRARPSGDRPDGRGFREAITMPGVRLLIVGWAAVLIVGSVLLSVAAILRR